jgi:thioredoxin-like negative regulator of GroEL
MAGSARRQQLEAMLAESPGDPELRYFLAMDYATSGEDERAAEALGRLTADSPDYVPAFVQAGQILARLGRDDEARAAFRAGIAAANRTGNAHAAGEMEAFLDSLG